MRLITLILTFLIAVYAYFYFFPVEKVKDIAPSAVPQSTPNQSSTHLKRRDYSSLKESIYSLNNEEKIALRKKIYLALLNAIHKNNPDDIENLKIAFEKVPEDPELTEKVSQALVLRNIKALKERSPLIAYHKNSPEIKQAFDELLIIFAILDDEKLSHTNDLLNQGPELFNADDINQRKSLLAKLSGYFKQNPLKAIALLELYPEVRDETFVALLNTNNKKNLNQYLSYATKEGIVFKADLPSDGLFEEAQNHFSAHDFEEALVTLELLSRIDPSLRDPKIAYANALYNQDSLPEFLNEISNIDIRDPALKERIALAQITTGDKETGLNTLKNTRPLNEDRSWRELAVDHLDRGQYYAALKELKHIKHPYYYDDAITALIKFRQQKYEEALGIIKDLPPSIRQTQGIKIIEVESLLSEGRENDALNLAFTETILNKKNTLYDPFFEALESENPLSLTLSRVHIKADNKELALQELEKSPSSFQTEVDKTKLNIDTGRWRDAEKTIAEATKLKSTNQDTEYEALYERLSALVFFERGEYLDAFYHFKLFANLKKDSVIDLIPRIDTAFKIQRYDIAKSLLSNLDQGPINTFYQFKLDHYLVRKEGSVSISADILDALNDTQKKEIALIYFERGLYSQGKNVANSIKNKSALLELYSTIGDFKLADPLAKELLDEKSFDAYHALSLYYDRTSQTNESFEALKNALALKPHDLDLQSSVYAFPRPLNEIEKQTLEMQTEIEKPNSSISSKVLLGRLYLTEGIARQAENKESYYVFPWDKAQLLFENILKILPEAPVIYLNQGQTYLLLNKVKESLKYFNKGLDLAQFSPELSRFLAIALDESDSSREASSLLEATIAKSPFDPSLWSTIGNIQKDSNHLLESRDSWQNYIKLKPKDPYGYFALASLAESLNNPESAIQSISKIIAIDPSNEKAKIKLKTLLSDPYLRLSPKEKNKLDELIK